MCIEIPRNELSESTMTVEEKMLYHIKTSRPEHLRDAEMKKSKVRFHKVAELGFHRCD